MDSKENNRVRPLPIRPTMRNTYSTYVRYLYKIIAYNDPDGPHFPIHLLPKQQLQWAVVDLNALVMHKMHKSRPLLIWIMGTLINYHETSTIDNPIPRLSVTIDFLRKIDRDAATSLYNSSSSSKIQTMDDLTAISPTRDDDGPAVRSVINTVSRTYANMSTFIVLRPDIRCNTPTRKQVQHARHTSLPY